MAFTIGLGAFERDRYEQEMYYRQREGMMNRQMNAQYSGYQDAGRQEVKLAPKEVTQPVILLLL